MRAGFGRRHPGLATVLDHRTPVDSYDVVWGNGSLPLRISTYLGADIELPDVLVTSVRCVVEARGQIVVCRSPDELHALPGGRRERGETYRDTAVREVYEETGWHLDAACLGPLGFVHLELRGSPPPDYAYPHPDAAQLVFGGLARSRAEVRDADWVDPAGWEQGSFLVAKDEVLDLALSQSSTSFVRAYLAVS
jgi:ADP-ribose pyrophosphatase YjhB (NUDIX family)